MIKGLFSNPAISEITLFKTIANGCKRFRRVVAKSSILNVVGFPERPLMIVYKNLKSHLHFFPLFLHEMVKWKLIMYLVFSKGQKKFTARTNISRTNDC